MDMCIRAYAPDDREAVVALSLRAWEPGYAALERTLGESVYGHVVGDWRRVQSRDVQADLDAEEVRVWVAVTGRVAGFVSVRLDREGRIGEIHMLGVDPDQQGEGLGSALTEFAVERIREEGMAVAVIRTGGDVAHASARAVYEKAGFVPSPVVHYYRSL
ncbi:GNAT family N-acetyltransferase [Nocardiopsis nanhaiensis]